MAKKLIVILSFAALAMAGTAQAQNFRSKVNMQLAAVSDGRCATIPHMVGFGAGAVMRAVVNECFANLYREHGLTYEPIENGAGFERAFNERLVKLHNAFD